jgi:hypothetical protein
MSKDKIVPGAQTEGGSAALREPPRRREAAALALTRQALRSIHSDDVSRIEMRRIARKALADIAAIMGEGK